MKAILKNMRISPKKLNLVAGLVRGEMVDMAIARLSFTPKKAAQILMKVIQSAAANASNNFKQDKGKLYIKEIVVNEAPTLKRSISVSKGRMFSRKKRNSHVTVRVEVKTPSAPAPAPTPNSEQ